MATPNNLRVLALSVAIFIVACTQRESPRSDCAHGTLGIEPADISREFRTTHNLPRDLRGAVVASALQDGPTGLAGVRKDDVLLAIAGKPVTNACDAVDALFKLNCDPVDVVVWRGGSRLTMNLTPVPAYHFLDGKCRAGDTAACFRVAWLLWNGNGVEADQMGALGMYRLACDKGWPDACAHLGFHLRQTSAPSSEILDILGRSCDLGSASGCANLAYLYATGTLVAQDDARATQLYVRSCDLGDALGCYNVGLMYNEGRGVEKDIRRAIDAYEEGCRNGSSSACTDLGWFYENGSGVVKDEKRAAELYRLGCNGTKCQSPNRRGCVNLAIAYRDGTGVPAEPSRAASLLRTACEEDVVTDDPNAQDSRSHACSLLGAMYLEGQGVPFDYELARSFSERGCRGQNRLGCYNAAVIFARGYGVETDMAQTAKFYQLACDLDDGESCYLLSQLYSKGDGVERNPARAAKLEARACTLGFDAACH